MRYTLIKSLASCRNNFFSTVTFSEFTLKNMIQFTFWNGNYIQYDVKSVPSSIISSAMKSFLQAENGIPFVECLRNSFQRDVDKEAINKSSSKMPKILTVQDSLLVPDGQLESTVKKNVRKFLCKEAVKTRAGLN